ncbi:hypothetical protein EIP91_005342 [Steccherinum ochraceum]|uniref:F-box domain-containing protein n=1 Tax=Steccherinum ochraceum TaxID=92696 RepID=A0A4R0RFP4_9APHY|nr:hypothetical protein EIP91_005342 [Steccherinum ochraceum]
MPYPSHPTGIGSLPFELLCSILEHLKPRRRAHVGVEFDDRSETDDGFNDSEEESSSGSQDGFNEADGVEDVSDSFPMMAETSSQFHVYFRKSDILCCGSVSKLWREAALPLLFEEVWVSYWSELQGQEDGMEFPDGSYGRKKSLEAFVAFLEAHPTIRCFIQVLTLVRRDMHNFEHEEVMPDPSHTTMAALLARTFLPKLRVLRMDDVLLRASSDDPSCFADNYAKPVLQRLEMRYPYRSAPLGISLNAHRVLDLLSIFGEIGHLELFVIQDSLEFPEEAEALCGHGNLELSISSLSMVTVSSETLLDTLGRAGAFKLLSRIAFDMQMARVHEVLLVHTGPKLEHLFVRLTSTDGWEESPSLELCTSLQTIAFQFTFYGDAAHIPNRLAWRDIESMLHSLIHTSPPLQLVTLSMYYMEWQEAPHTNPGLFKDAHEEISAVHDTLCRLADNCPRLSVVIRHAGHHGEKMPAESKPLFEDVFHRLHERGKLSVLI